MYRTRVVMQVLLATAALSLAQAQQFVISTYAGGPPSTMPVAAVKAEIRAPQAVTTDAAGNLYISEFNRIRMVSADGTITRLAGTGIPGYSGDGGPATSAQLFLDSGLYSFPGGLVVDSSGNLFLADTGNNRVRKVSRDGIITTVAGNGADLHPAGLAVDSSDNLYVADRASLRIQKISPTGGISIVAGNGTPFYSGDGGPATNAGLAPTGLTIDGKGNLFIADGSGFRIRKVSPAGIITTVAGNGSSFYAGDGGLATSAGLAPVGLAIDDNGNLFFGDASSFRVRKVSPSGIISTVAGTGTPGYSGDGGAAASAQLHGTFGVAVDRVGNIYIADTYNNRVRMISPAGIITTVAGFGLGDGAAATSAQLSLSPWGGGLAIDRGGNLYIADMNNFVVRKISVDGSIGTVAGVGPPNGHLGDGGPATNAQVFYYPQSLALDREGNLFIADIGDYRVRKVSTDGIISTPKGTGIGRPLAVDSAGSYYTIDNGNDDFLYRPLIVKNSPDGVTTIVAGNASSKDGLGDGGPAMNGRLTAPFALAIDSADNLYIADIGDNRVRKVSAEGTITTVAGNGTRGYSGDGGPAMSAQLNVPVALAVDSAGNIFIVDTYNNRVRMVSPDGIITTIAGDGTQGYSADGGPATNAQFGSLSGMAIDNAGNLYVSDQLYNAVRLLRRVDTSSSEAGKP